MRILLASSILLFASAAQSADIGAATLCRPEVAPATAPEVIAPKVLERVNPMPPMIRGDHIAVIDAIIDERGRVSDICPVSGDVRFVRAVSEAVRQWRFSPARTRDGKPLAVRFHLTTRFRY
jgi:hypothetical protein